MKLPRPVRASRAAVQSIPFRPRLREPAPDGQPLDLHLETVNGGGRIEAESHSSAIADLGVLALAEQTEAKGAQNMPRLLPPGAFPSP